jgi:hypothetical protein
VIRGKPLSEGLSRKDIQERENATEQRLSTQGAPNRDDWHQGDVVGVELG